MSSFYTLMSFMAVNGFEYSDPGSFDMINNLPVELAIIILRMLPGKDLLNAASVNKKWFNLCQSDFKLRQKIRRYIRHQRRVEISARLFGAGRRNGHLNVSNRPTMTNVINTVGASRLRVNRFSSEPSSTTRYMPLPSRREAAFESAGNNASKRRKRELEGATSTCKKLRM